MNIVSVLVPDLGDIEDVLVSELLVKPGDGIAVDQPVALVESDKASMEIPSTVSGTVASIPVSAGERVSKGTVLVEVEAGEAAAAAPSPAPAAASGPRPAPGPARRFDLAVIGGGPGGYSAAFRAADLGLSVALIERGETLGGVCLNVGCIPSKALLHVAAIKEEAERLAAHGVSFGAPEIDLDLLRRFRDRTVSGLTDGLAQMARMRDVEHIRGEARFAGPNALSVTPAAGGTIEVAFASCIVASGSSPVRLPFLPDDPRIVDSTGALELPFIPRRMLVVGGGIIGLEMATVYSSLGARIDIVEQADRLLPVVDRDLAAIWNRCNAHRFDRIMLSTRVVEVRTGPGGVRARFDGENAEATYDLVLQAAGRRPEAGRLGLEAAGLEARDGFIPVDAAMRTRQPHIFAVGDVVGQPMLAHKAVHQGHVAAEGAAGLKAGFDALAIPSVAYTDPEIAWVGVTEEAAMAGGHDVEVARFPWSASGRAIANGAGYGLTKLVFARETGRIVGGAIVGPSAGDMIGEIGLAIELGADALDIGRTIHPHPTLGETIGMAAEAAAGTCTDLPKAGRRARRA